jgi:hypothetical protein
MNYEMRESMSLIANTAFRVRSRQLFAHEYVLPQFLHVLPVATPHAMAPLLTSFPPQAGKCFLLFKISHPPHRRSYPLHRRKLSSFPGFLRR